MKSRCIVFFSLTAMILLACGGGKQVPSSSEPSLKEKVSGKFHIGVALNTRQFTGKDTSAVRLVKHHFNSIVAENAMKCAVIHPEEGRFDFKQADQFVRFGETNGMFVIGHCLVWHSQSAPWFCVDKDGKRVTPEILKARLKDHIYTVVGRYKGRVKGWDVVNEAILEDGSWRKSVFYEILGEDYIPLAFQYAHEADPDAELYYNDYAMDKPEKRKAVVKLIHLLKEKGLRIDAVGMQAHMGIDYPAVADFEQSLIAFAKAGVKVAITEWDMSALPSVQTGANIADTVVYRKSYNPYPDALPDSVSHRWNSRMRMFFDLFIKHAAIISRVTVWGVSDGDSWKNNWPVRGRKDYPLLFDRHYEPKPFVRDLLMEKT